MKKIRNAFHALHGRDAPAFVVMAEFCIFVVGVLCIWTLPEIGIEWKIALSVVVILMIATFISCFVYQMREGQSRKKPVAVYICEFFVLIFLIPVIGWYLFFPPKQVAAT